MAGRLVILGIAIGVAAAALTGCDFTHEPELDARAPGMKIPAIVRASDPGEARELAELVQSLEHSDPAVRLFAVQSLQERTGQQFGYDPYDPPEQRAEAIARWRLWLGGGNPSLWEIREPTAEAGGADAER